jgi:hypothetical protein
MRFTLPASIALILTAAAVSINAGQSVTSQSSVTFTKDVAPIFQNNCQVCHRPGSIAPMSLLTYAEARPWARSIKLKVAAREMPPWFIDKNVGVQHFSNDRSLSDRDIDTIVKWVDAGAPEGNPADMPPPRQFPAAEAWQIGQPDVIVSLPKDYIVPAKAPDRWPDILVDPHLTEDRYIKAVQIMPTKGFTVIHHIRTSIVEPTDATLGSGKLDDADVPLEVGEQGVFLNEYAIGKQGDVFPDGSGRLIKAGTKINFQMHLHATGKEDTPTNVMLGLKFYPKGYMPNHAINSTTVSAREVDIRPHTDNVRSDGYLTLKNAARLLSFQPHMHNRGSRQCVEAIFPNGKVETLSCAKHNFAWMLNYTYADDVAPLLPAYTMLHVISWYDNTAANKYNPDPRNPAGFGNRSVDEMGFSWINSHSLTEEEFKRLVAERASKRSSN